MKRSGWRKGVFETVIGKWKILLCYGPNLELWAQWNQGDGGALGFAWFTVSWNRCVCEESEPDCTWYYCSYHRKGLHGFNQ